MELILVIKQGEGAGRPMRLAEKSRVTVGTSQTSDVVIKDDPLMDEEHFRIDRMQSGSLWIQDLMSQAGTTVNGGRIQRVQIKAGDVVCAGKLVLEVCANTDATLHSGMDAESSSPSSGEMSWSGDSSASISNAEHNDPVLQSSLEEYGYSLGAKLGSGTFGCVYRAVRRSDGQDIAVKVFDGLPIDSPERMKLFYREMDVHRQLDHPHIVRFFEHGANEQYLAWFAMEFVDGPNLSEMVRGSKQPLPVVIACSIIKQILLALDYAHRLSTSHGPVVHRDLKPSNIMIDRSKATPMAKVCDFGLAKFFEQAGVSSMTSTGQSRGNLEYMSPDQAIDSKYSGPDVDVYATGGILHFCLTGKSLYDVEPGASATKILNAKMSYQTIRVNQFREDVPNSVQAIIDRATGRDQTRRFRTAGQMLRSIENVIDTIGQRPNDP